MKHIIPIEIDCGENTCAKEPGEFCHLLTPGIMRGGECFLFGKVFDVNGWIVRHPKCKSVAELMPNNTQTLSI